MIADHVSGTIADRENSAAALEFARLGKFIMKHNGSMSRAVLAAESGKLDSIRPLTVRTMEILRKSGADDRISRDTLRKSAVNPVGLTALADYRIIAQAFVQSLANATAFDSMLASMVPVPLGTGTVGAVTVGLQAGPLLEGSVKPVSRLSITSQQMVPTKAVGVATVTAEVARSDISNALEFVSRAMRLAVAQATDQQFIANIVQGISIPSSLGPTAEAVRTDISNMLDRITTGSDSRLFIITTPLVVKRWSMLTDQKGISAFPDLTPTGGSINGMRVIPSDGVQMALSAGNVILADASGIAAASGEVALEQYKEGLIASDSTPDSPPTGTTVLTSLFAENKVAIVVERFICAVKLRSDAVAACLNTNSYGSGGSPP